ncbi:transcription factor HES-3 [Ornithorhynchus anatinus]|uniref:transcription factor HES-3 n=1 Tax=Ornithorhynchus anatinus TaxID=9258 RepID=UPI0010A9400C|nr:transcription factor HES-3 [Ornithorhynchus anatinus]
MEKKRRARINVSLEQLKALLEKHYAHQIRKRKLEKADILELSVKYMKSLQSSVEGMPGLTSAEYQAGFRSCLHGVSQFLGRSLDTGPSWHRHLLQDTRDSGIPGAGPEVPPPPPPVRLPVLGSPNPRDPRRPAPACIAPRPCRTSPPTTPRPGHLPPEPGTPPSNEPRGTDGAGGGGREQPVWRPW